MTRRSSNATTTGVFVADPEMYARSPMPPAPWRPAVASVTVRCQTAGSACPPGHTRMRMVVGFVPVTCVRSWSGAFGTTVKPGTVTRFPIAVSAVPLKREACTCTAPPAGSRSGSGTRRPMADGGRRRRRTGQLPVTALSMRTVAVRSMSTALVAGRNAPRLADGAGNAIVPRPPPTSKSAAGPKREYVPPVAAAPQPSTTVRPNASAAMVVVATARNVAVYAVSATGWTACTGAPPSDHDSNS